MGITHTQESISKELKRIQDNVPVLFKTNLFINVKKTPTLEFIAQKALEDNDYPEEKKAQLKRLLDEGTLSKELITEDPKVAKQRDLWVQREIKKSVSEGRLPTRKQLKELKITFYGNN